MISMIRFSLFSSANNINNNNIDIMRYPFLPLLNPREQLRGDLPQLIITQEAEKGNQVIFGSLIEAGFRDAVYYTVT